MELYLLFTSAERCLKGDAPSSTESVLTALGQVVHYPGFPSRGVRASQQVRISESPSRAIQHRRHLKIGFVATLVVALRGSYGATGRCPESRDTSLNLSVASHRNITGHWIVSVDVARVDPKRALTLKSPRQVALKVEHSTASCEDYELVQITAIAVAPPGPPADYEVVNGLGHYKMHTTALRWEDARDKCVQEGAHLIIINSDEEAEVVRTYFIRKPKAMDGVRFTHVGFHDRYVEGQYITVLGEPLDRSGYVRWDTSLPNKLESHNCGFATKDVKYHDGPCDWLHLYICEFQTL